MFLPLPTGDFEITPSGTFAARCYRFLDLGTQPVEYQGQTTFKRKVSLAWELPTELMTRGDNAGKPFSGHRRYTWSMHEKSILRQHLESWRGRKFSDSDFGANGFDTKKLLGVPCMISIVHSERNGRTSSIVTSVSPLMKGFDIPPQVNPSLYFGFDDVMKLEAESERRAMIEEVFAKLSQNMRETIQHSPEYLRALGQIDSESHDDDDFDQSIPF